MSNLGSPSTSLATPARAPTHLPDHSQASGPHLLSDVFHLLFQQFVPLS